MAIDPNGVSVDYSNVARFDGFSYCWSSEEKQKQEEYEALPDDD